MSELPEDPDDIEDVEELAEELGLSGDALENDKEYSVEEESFLREATSQLEEDGYNVVSVYDLEEAGLFGEGPGSRGNYFREVREGNAAIPTAAESSPAYFFILEEGQDIDDLENDVYRAALDREGNIRIADEELLGEEEFDQFLREWQDWRTSREIDETLTYRDGAVRVTSDY